MSESAEWKQFWTRPGDPGENSTHRHADNLSRDVVTTTVEYQPQQLDGTVEHGPLKVLVDGKRPKPADDSKLVDHLARLTPAERLANQMNYSQQAAVAPGVIDDFEEVAYQTNVALPNVALYMLAQGGLPNAARVQYYIGQHPDVAAEMMTMTPKQVQKKILDLSVKLQTDRESMELDKSDYATYRAVRNRQEAERYR